MRYCYALILIVLLSGCGSSGKVEYEQGLRYLNEGKADLAEKSFRKAAQKNPDRASCYVNIAKLYLGKGWLDSAETNALRAVDVLETNRRTVTGIPYEQVLSEAYNTLGEIEIQKSIQAQATLDLQVFRKHISTAMTHFTRAYQLNPSNASADANLKKYKKMMM